MLPKFLEMIFGVNYKTATGTIMSAISLVPTAIQQLGLTEVPESLRFAGLICFFVSFIYTGIQQKDKDVTGAGASARIIDDDIKMRNQIRY